MHGSRRRDAGGITKVERVERRQRAAVERGDQGCTPGVGDLGAFEVELLELLQPSSRRRRRACSRRRRYEGGEALVAERVVREAELLQRGPPPQGRRKGRQTRVADGGVFQIKAEEQRQGTSVQGGGKCRGACVAHVHIGDVKEIHGW